ncbi:E3 ubiquitin-protein ligase Zswim2 [Kappamyces sp. JEL0829]|nr:E3 ubiquitin-protein ligase Zswim2 [Kappamyces sp. JEL0829]
MSRSYIAKCPPSLLDAIEQALASRLYILQEIGPMAFIVKGDAERKYKVGIGSRHQCSCAALSLKSNYCLHTLWVLLKVFHVDSKTPILWQSSLVEREIEELLQTRNAFREHRQTRTLPPSGPAESSPGGSVEEGVPARPVDKDDVCPICQDELLGPGLPPLVHCQVSCGNSIHAKCMKILLQHQESLGASDLKCPFCRQHMGSVDLIKEKIEGTMKKKTPAKKHTHYGMECHDCHSYPIKGTLFK